MLKCVRIVSGTTKDFVLQTTPLSRVGSSLPDGIVNQVSASPQLSPEYPYCFVDGHYCNYLCMLTCSFVCN